MQGVGGERARGRRHGGSGRRSNAHARFTARLRASEPGRGVRADGYRDERGAGARGGRGVGRRARAWAREPTPATVDEGPHHAEARSTRLATGPT